MIKVFFSFLFLLFFLIPCCYSEVSFRLRNETEVKAADGTFDKGKIFFRGIINGSGITGMAGLSLDLTKKAGTRLPEVTPVLPVVWGFSGDFPYVSVSGGAVSSSGILSLANEPAPGFFSPYYSAFSVKYTKLLSLNRYATSTSNPQAGILGAFVFSPLKIRVQCGTGWRKKGGGFWGGGEFFTSLPGGKKLKGGILVSLRKKGVENKPEKLRLYPQFPQGPYPYVFSYFALEEKFFGFRASGAWEFYRNDIDSGFFRLDYKLSPLEYLGVQGGVFYSLPRARNLDGDFISTRKSLVFSVNAGKESFSTGFTAMAKVKTPEKPGKLEPGIFRFQLRLKKNIKNRDFEFIYELPEWEFYKPVSKEFLHPSKNLFTLSYWDFFPFFTGITLNLTGNLEFKTQNDLAGIKKLKDFFPGQLSRGWIGSCFDIEFNRDFLLNFDFEGGWKTLYSRNVVFSDFSLEGRLEKKLKKLSFYIKLWAGTGFEKNIEKNEFDWDIHSGLTLDCKY